MLETKAVLYTIEVQIGVISGAFLRWNSKFWKPEKRADLLITADVALEQGEDVFVHPRTYWR